MNTAYHGARLLDRVMPRLGVDAWWDEINLHLLWMSSTSYCVLGQLFGKQLLDGTGWFQSGFQSVEKYLIRDLKWDYVDRVLPAFRRNGFVEGGWNEGPDYDSLTASWAYEIQERRAGNA